MYQAPDPVDGETLVGGLAPRGPRDQAETSELDTTPVPPDTASYPAVPSDTASYPAVPTAPSGPGETSPGAGSGGGGWWPPSGPGGWWPPPAPPPAPSRHNGLRAGLAVALAAAAVVGGIAIGHSVWGSGSTPSATSSPGNTVPGLGGNSPGGSSGPSNASAIASAVDPALVDVNTTLGYQGAQAAGTGMVLTSTGEILTNNHVINGATSVSVTDVGNGRTYKATVVGYSWTQDVAVLQLQGASGLTTVPLGDSSTVKVNDSVLALGNAGGVGGTPSQAGGSVTALNQSITATDQSNGVSERLSGLIETDAPIQPGDSGGPLVNAAGKVIGMNTAASSGFSFETGSTQGYAIPINSALSLVHQIEKGQSSDTIHIGPTAFLGVEIRPQGTTGNGSFGGSGGSLQGAQIVGVTSGGPAAQAGLAAGDVITSVGGTTVTSPSSLTDVLRRYHPGDTVQVGWTDTSGQTHSASITLVNGPAG